MLKLKARRPRVVKIYKLNNDKVDRFMMRNIIINLKDYLSSNNF